ncbi:MAG: YcxB family protein [Verrucomicrobiales bacterium]
MSPEFKFSGKTTFEEYLECHKVIASKRRLLLRSFLIIYGAGATFYGIQTASIIFGALGVFALAYGLLISPIHFKSRVRKNWESYPAAQKPRESTLKKEGISVRGDDGNFIVQSWENYISYRETTSLFLIYVSPLMPIILPKRLLVETKVEDCREFLDTIFKS